MITKIDIEKYGLYSKYKWDLNIGNTAEDIFKKLNIIYGRNYSGKTTLSRIIRSVELNVANDKYSEAEFVITNSDGSKSSNNNLSSPYNIRVYNTDFVRDNLKFLYDENGDIKPFTLLGSENQSLQNDIDKIMDELGSVDLEKGLLFKHSQDEISIDKAKKELKKRSKDLLDKKTNKANREIKINHYFIKQGTNYNIVNIQHEIDEIIGSKCTFTLSEQLKNELKRIIDEQGKNNIQEIAQSKPKLSDRINNVRKIVSKSISVTNTIQELITEIVLQSWVDKGRELHREKRTHCAFCGGEISTDRWRIIDAHFSKESDELKSEIDAEIRLLEVSKYKLNIFLEEKGVKKECFYSVFHPRFDEILNQWNDVYNQYNKNIDLLILALKKRKEEIFTPFKTDDIIDNSENIIDVIKLFNQLIRDQNEYTAQLEIKKEESRKKLRFETISAFIKDINYEKEQQEIVKEDKNISTLTTEFDILSNKITSLKTERKQKEFALKDEAAAALKVNELLTRFFGHNGLKLEPETITEEGDPKTRFIIKRGDKKAYNLSEGECSLISFCYFIAKMDDELKGPENEKLIIYIDDPISSLDNNHIFFMFSLIESIICKEKKYGQLFISTHNLEFLKYSQKLTYPKKQIKHFEIKRKQCCNNTISIINYMPNYLKDNISEYSFLFKEIYNVISPLSPSEDIRNERNYTHFYNLANNMRKFLECYLSYRLPNSSDPIKRLDILFDNNIPSLVNRVINEGSHLAWGDRGTLPQDVVEAETVAKEILKAIKTKDQCHFESLCESVGVNKDIEFC